MGKSIDTSKSQKFIKSAQGHVQIFDISHVTQWGLPDPASLPFSIKVLLENALRNCDDYQVTFSDIETIAKWSADSQELAEIAFKPGRVILQDFTGVPCVVDLAAMRSAMKRLGGDVKKINPQVRCDLVIDHSVQVDEFGSAKAFDANLKKEFSRNNERYEFLKWGQSAFKNFSVVPPGTGIVHQVNLEYLADGVLKTEKGNDIIAYPDSLVGTDSHTTMINGLGILGWGVGGIEAEAVMLGEPIYMLLPQVVGLQLTGQLPKGVTATDLVLTVTQILREKGVVGKFVEFFGSGLKNLSLPDRATISNMAPEYGATVGIFPIDDETLRYYKVSGRDEKQVDVIEHYMKEQGMFYNEASEVKYSETLTLNMNDVQPSLAGPKRPQDKIVLSEMKNSFENLLLTPISERGFGLDSSAVNSTADISNGSGTSTLGHGSVVIAAITSCTNTSNPSVLIGAALLAKKAVECGLRVPSYVKTSFAPGSQVVSEYLEKANLLTYLEDLGFHIIGYGCTTCIGNSGPLPENVANAVEKGDIIAASVLSGNRNFEGRINPLCKANYLASPPLVVAFALAGRVDVDLSKEALGNDKEGNPVYLKDIWPDEKEIHDIISKNVNAAAFRKRYKDVDKGNKNWNQIKSKNEEMYSWNEKSTYIQEPPFFIGMKPEAGRIEGIQDSRVLVKVGDSITTDHISPAGAIAKNSPAGNYLLGNDVEQEDFNSYGSRRGNDKVMTRGTFANIRLRNQLVPGEEGSCTMHFPSEEKMSIYDAAQLYLKDKTPLIVLAGKEYGTGSSRDWAAKGTALLGVKVVIAQSYERIHRSNLAGMGVLPLEFQQGESFESLNIKGDEIFGFDGIDENLKPRSDVRVKAVSANGKSIEFKCTCRLDTPVEIDYYRNGGILPTVIRKLLKSG